MQRQAIFFVGRPGSGKDEQARRLVDEYGFQPVPSSQLIDQEFKAHSDDPDVQNEMARNKAGLLNSPKFVAKLIMRFVESHAAEGAGFVFSGSPRTIEEAEVEIPAMQKLYGSENVILVMLVLDKEVARWRIEHRRICRAHKHPVPWTPETEKLTTCPIDGSELFVRPLDAPELVDTRFRKYEELTEPTLKIFEKYGVPFFPIDATKSIEAMHQDVAVAVERRQSAVSPQ